MYQKKLIFLSNFFSADLMSIPISAKKSDIITIIAMKSEDFLQSKSLFLLNNSNTIWNFKVVFDRNGRIDRRLMTNANGIVPTRDTYCLNFENSKVY
jgi:hypothetical protein